MKLQIEKWVEENKPFKENEAANDLFEESVRCYKNGAYKSAFIMSYLSFKVTLRGRILECTYGKELVKPNPKFWEDEIIKKLEDDGSWENYLNTIVDASCSSSNKKEIAILDFTNGEQVKTAYNYWKNIRNDCAHAKGRITIDSSTVESFWNYLMDNLSDFYVLGGEEYLLRELKNLYQYYPFPEIVEQDSVKIIMNDVNAVYKKNSKDFFQKLFKKLEGRHNRKGQFVNNSNKKFWKDILEANHENVRQGIVEVISSDAMHFLNFYSYYPQLLELSVSLNSKFVVNDLCKWLNSSDYFTYDFKKNFWIVLVEILDRYTSHVDIKKVVNRQTLELIDSFEQDERNLRILNCNGVFKEYIFEVSSWFFKTDAGSQYDNYSRFQSREAELIELSFEYLEWDSECIRILNYALVDLESSMASRSNMYSKSNGSSYKIKCERIICKNKDKIMNIPDIDLKGYSEVFRILNSCNNE
ncbi:hypothetical protein [Psychrobacillus psychrodurans]|uniref:hypothetical protein n=1 Tax=Psychrobacillus psychrodurans TaxID=126157 RepID=UPI003D05684B